MRPTTSTRTCISALVNFVVNSLSLWNQCAREVQVVPVMHLRCILKSRRKLGRKRLIREKKEFADTTRLYRSYSLVNYFGHLFALTGSAQYLWPRSPLVTGSSQVASDNSGRYARAISKFKVKRRAQRLQPCALLRPQLDKPISAVRFTAGKYGDCSFKSSWVSRFDCLNPRSIIGEVQVPKVLSTGDLRSYFSFNENAPTLGSLHLCTRRRVISDKV
ncbi:hypothetical protein EDB92DRAFT_1574414 [Lactarius akahatsu]|uniref:Uncharacterized protein n=1 Tax=Lactarius akahatsu TaxID=416441 RepID=A0AAD4L804_9AGAM|nr:hypothetical protein EDB92DRAFT_1574414 [Lactarius akahatsu]